MNYCYGTGAGEIDEFFERKRSWSKIKDKIVGDYIVCYLKTVRYLRRPILIVDGFAGPGFSHSGFAHSGFAHPGFAPRSSRFAFHDGRFFHHRHHRFFFVGAPYAYAAYDSCWRRVWTPYGLQWANVCGDYGYY